MIRSLAITVDLEYPDRLTHGDPLAVIAALHAESARATFFVEGRWALAYPEIVRTLSEDGNLIGNHSHWHAPLPLLSSEGMRDTILQAREALMAAGVEPTPWFRLPYGRGMRHRDTLATLQALGYQTVGWDIDARDWEPQATSWSVADAVIAGLDACQEEDPILLLHSWPYATAKAMPIIFAELRQREIPTCLLTERVAAGC